MEIRAKILVQRLEAWLLARLGSEGRIPLDVERILVGLAAVVFGAGVVGAVGAATGLFRVFAVPVLALVPVGAAGLVALAARGRLASRLDRFDWIALGVAALAALSAGLLHHEYAQGQMDIGFYTNDAYVTAQTGGRDLHGPDDHLLPGFAPAGDGSVRAVIMFGYSSLAAYFALLGGYWAVPWVNAPLVFLTILSVYTGGRLAPEFRVEGPHPPRGAREAG